MKKSVSFILVLSALLTLSAPAADKVGALGRIIPAGDLINLMGPGDAVATVHATEGTVVEAGAPLVTFRSLAAAERDVNLAELAVREADELGGRTVEALELKEKVTRHDKEFSQMRLTRFAELGGESLSAQQMEQRTYLAKNADLAHQVALKELERGRLDREIKLKRAKEQLEVARDKRDRCTLRAPDRVSVVKLGVLPGSVPVGPAVVLARMDKMQVVAEVFAADLLKLKPGMKATISSTALPGPITGRVLSIGRLITGRSKVAEAVIELDDATTASRLINLEVNVSIEL